MFCRLKKLWTICPFYPQNLLKGFSKQSRYSIEFFFSMFMLLSRVRKINWLSFWWCQCVLCYASLSSKYFWPLFILYKNVKVFLFTASVKDQFISTWFTYSCVTKGNVLKVTVKLLSLQLYSFASVNEMHYNEPHNILGHVCSLWGIKIGVTVMTLSRLWLCKIFTGKLMHVRLQ